MFGSNRIYTNLLNFIWPGSLKLNANSYGKLTYCKMTSSQHFEQRYFLSVDPQKIEQYAQV